MLKIELPFWMNKGELKKLNLAAQGFWETVERWMRISLSKFDLMTCDLIIVDHVAWERKISRLDGEIESIYRKRVQFAFINAKDAGMNRGIYNIFERLGIPVYDIKERQPGKDWDIVTIEMNDDLLSGNKNLVNLLIQTYGATCRRYEYSVTATTNQYVSVGEMACSYKTHIAELPPIPGIKVDYQLTPYNDNGRLVAAPPYGDFQPRNGLSGVTGDMKRIDVDQQGKIHMYIRLLPLKIKSISEIRANYSNALSLVNARSISRININGDIDGNDFSGFLHISYGEWRLVHKAPSIDIYNNLLPKAGTSVPMTIYYDALTN